jgi:hypothetical protein
MKMEYGQKQTKDEEKKYLGEEKYKIGWPSTCMKLKSDLEDVLDA